MKAATFKTSFELDLELLSVPGANRLSRKESEGRHSIRSPVRNQKSPYTIVVQFAKSAKVISEFPRSYHPEPTITRTHMAQKRTQQAEVYTHAMHTSQNYTEKFCTEHNTSNHEQPTA